MSADWRRDLGSKFEGLDPSLCLNMNIEEIDGVEVRKYWSIHRGTDLSRTKFEGWATEASSALKPSLGTNPFDHFCYALQEDQRKNNEDYRRRPAGNEVVSTTKTRTGGEVRKEDRAGLAKWSKALRAAENIINKAALEDLERRRQKVKAPRAQVVKGRIATKNVFDKAIEIAPSYGVPKQVIRAIKQAKYVVKTERTTCTIPNAGAAAATFFSRLATEALKLERLQVREEAPAARSVDKDRKKRRVTEPLDEETFHVYLRTMKKKHPEMKVLEMCAEVDRRTKTQPRKSWQAKSRSATWVGNHDHPDTKSSVKNFYSTVLRGNTPA